MSRKRAERGAERLIDAVGAVLATPAGKARIDCLARRIAGIGGSPEWCRACDAAANCATLQAARLRNAMVALGAAATQAETVIFAANELRQLVERAEIEAEQTFGP